MKVETLHDQLYFGTVRLECHNGSAASFGTGFLMVADAGSLEGEAGDVGQVPFLVTNRHVVEGADDFMLIHMIGQTGEQAPAPALGKPTGMKILEVSDGFTFHPDDRIDVAVMPFGNFAEQLTQLGRPPFFKSVDTRQMLNREAAEELDSMEEVIFIGYPNALYDRANLTPIMRTGTTATPIVLDYNDRPAFLIDAAVFPGSSGSPVFLRDRGMYRKRDGSMTFGSRFYMLGVVAAAYTQSIYAELEESPTAYGVTLQDPLNLGIVYKASAIIDCVDAALAREGMRRSDDLILDVEEHGEGAKEG
jgi:Trypsin-like peptidase domain